VIRPFEDILATRRCPFGNPRCSDERPCSMHERWKPVKEAFRELLENTTVADIIQESD
jgi:DNA-binding IscR family transcriptional regulator